MACEAAECTGLCATALGVLVACMTASCTPIVQHWWAATWSVVMACEAAACTGWWAIAMGVLVARQAPVCMAVACTPMVQHS